MKDRATQDREDSARRTNTAAEAGAPADAIVTTIEDNTEDVDVRQLLMTAGPRPEPPDAVRERVHDTLLAAWQQNQRKQRRRLPLRTFALAASLLMVIGASYVAFNLGSEMPEHIGKVKFASGDFTLRGSENTVKQRIMPGTMIRTLDEGRVEIKLRGNAYVRFAGNTTAIIHRRDEIWLQRGRVYVDSPDKKDRVLIKTPGALVTDIGTQFEVAVDGDDLTVAVREGRVDLALAEQAVSAAAVAGMGEVIHVRGDRVLSMTPLSSMDPRWDWVHGATRRYELKGSSLAEFLKWSTREAGMELDFDSEKVRQASQTTILQGDISGMDPRKAIDDVMATTPSFVATYPEAHRVRIDFRR